MSGFFQALEQAKLERALLARAGRPEVDAPLAAHAPEMRQERPISPQAVSNGVEEHLVSLLTPTSFETEQYRTLCHLVEQMHTEAGLHIIAVSSAAPGDGKTITAINLAGALALAPETRVLLVEDDLRRPSISKYLGWGDSGDPGLVDVVLDLALSLEDVVRPRPPFNLAVLPAGRCPAAFYEVLKSPRLGVLLEQARHHYDYIVLDTSPLVPFPDCQLLRQCVDGFLVVVTAHKTPRKLLAEALDTLDPAEIVGLVFNNDDRLTEKSYYAYAYNLSRNGKRIGRSGRVGMKSTASLRQRLTSWWHRTR